MFLSYFVKETATTDIYTYCHTLSLHDALPICRSDRRLTCRLICTSAYSSCMKLREPYTRERDNEKPGGGLFGLDHLERHSRFSRHRTFARYVHTFYGVCADNR